MPYEVRDDVIDQIWRDLGQQIARPRVAAVAHEVAADLDDAKVLGYVPLFVRRLDCEQLSREVERQGRGKAVTPVLRRIGNAPCGANGGCSIGDAMRLPGLVPGDNFEGLARIAPNLFVMVSDDGGDASRPTRLVLFRFNGD